MNIASDELGHLGSIVWPSIFLLIIFKISTTCKKKEKQINNANPLHFWVINLWARNTPTLDGNISNIVTQNTLTNKMIDNLEHAIYESIYQHL